MRACLRRRRNPGEIGIAANTLGIFNDPAYTEACILTTANGILEPAASVLPEPKIPQLRLEPKTTMDMSGDVSDIRQLLGQVLMSLSTLKGIPAMGEVMLVSLKLLDEKRVWSVVNDHLRVVAKICGALSSPRPKASELWAFLRGYHRVGCGGGSIERVPKCKADQITIATRKAKNRVRTLRTRTGGKMMMHRVVVFFSLF